MPARRCFANELEELWRHWSTCANVSEVARRLQRPIPSVYSVLRERGGIAPRARRQRLQSLSIVEREEIAASSPSAPRCARSRASSAALLPRSAAKSRATAAATPTARTPPSNAPPSRHAARVPRQTFWQAGYEGMIGV